MRRRLSTTRPVERQRPPLVSSRTPLPEGFVQTKIIFLLFVIACIAGAAPAVNLAERVKVQGALNEYLTLSNAHMLSDRMALEKYLRDQAKQVVGDENRVDVFLYRVSARVPLDKVQKPDQIPAVAGVSKNAGYVEVSALVTRVWWSQRQWWIGQDKDVYAQKILYITADKLGPEYPRPPNDIDFMKNPALLLVND
jgi:hypothetical protein